MNTKNGFEKAQFSAIEWQLFCFIFDCQPISILGLTECRDGIFLSWVRWKGIQTSECFQYFLPFDWLRHKHYMLSTSTILQLHIMCDSKHDMQRMHIAQCSRNEYKSNNELQYSLHKERNGDVWAQQWMRQETV